MRKCVPSKEGALSLPPNEVSVGCAGRTQSTHKIFRGAAGDRKGTGSRKPGRQLFENVFWPKKGIGYAYATEHQNLAGLSNTFLLY